MIRRISIFLALAIIALAGCSNDKSETTQNEGVVTLVITVPQDTPLDATIALGAEFNQWDPSQGDYAFVRTANGTYIGSLPAYPIGKTLLFKVTRGDWETVEIGQDGHDITDRAIKIEQPQQQVEIEVYGWKDSDAFVEPESTAVTDIIVETVVMPTFNDERYIYIYLPSDYHQSNRDYPVIYMSDGSNLFDVTVGATHEWGMDELMERWQSEGSALTSIVVGIDHAGPNRMAEYSPWDFQSDQFGSFQGKGDEWAEWLVHTLKPQIDAQYRTLASREHTTIMGSSMGGLIACYSALKHQETFSKAGCYSPAFLQTLVGENLLDFIASTPRRYPMKIHMDMGDAELGLFGDDILNEMRQVRSALLQQGFSAQEIRYLEIPDGIHHESHWRLRTPEIIEWLNISVTQ